MARECSDYWGVGLSDRSNGFPLVEPKQVQIANPASFLAHKVLIHNKRTRGKVAKDILYIHVFYVCAPLLIDRWILRPQKNGASK